jgi:hypothetical protein
MAINGQVVGFIGHSLYGTHGNLKKVRTAKAEDDKMGCHISEEDF